MWVKLRELWTYRLGDIGQNVQHVQARAVSIASGKWLQLTYYLMTYQGFQKVDLQLLKSKLSLGNQACNTGPNYGRIGQNVHRLIGSFLDQS